MPGAWCGSWTATPPPTRTRIRAPWKPADIGTVNYIRNAVKATVDAYDGETHLYIFAPGDPIIGSYQHLFPNLFLPASAMPADLRAHARYPETLFKVQAEIYRTYHMLDPQSFYNKEDLWDLARRVTGQAEGAEAVSPTYVVASLPGETKAEFLLLTPFTPRNKDNMIGLMVARCDGPNLGDMVVLLLSKQKLIYGPMQIDSRINSDGTISKDLTLWNQQGSQVIRSQTLVLPVGNTFLYVDPIYIQATEARMPQLKKIVLAVGDRLIYADTYDEALAQLSQGAQQLVAQAAAQPAAAGAVPRRPPFPIRACRASAIISGAIANWPAPASGPKPARNWKPSKPKSASRVVGQTIGFCVEVSLWRAMTDHESRWSVLPAPYAPAAPAASWASACSAVS